MSDRRTVDRRQALPESVLVMGLGRAGEAVARACQAAGSRVVAVDDFGGLGPQGAR